MSKPVSKPFTLVGGKSQQQQTPRMKLILTRVCMLSTLFLMSFVISIIAFVDKIKSLYRKVVTAFRSHLSWLMQRQALEAHLTLMSLQGISSRQERQRYISKINSHLKRSADIWAEKYLYLLVRLFAILMLLGLLLTWPGPTPWSLPEPTQSQLDY